MAQKNNRLNVEKKRTRSDELLESLESIRNEQMIQTEYLKTLLNQNQIINTGTNRGEEEKYHLHLNEDVNKSSTNIVTTSNNLVMNGINGVIFHDGGFNNIGGGFNGVGGVESNSGDNMVDDEKNFETCLLKLLESYERMNGHDRPKKIRRVLNSLPMLNNSIQMIDEVQRESSSFLPPQINNGDCRNTHCPYREQIYQINNFYTDLLNEPFNYDTTLVGL